MFAYLLNQVARDVHRAHECALGLFMVGGALVSIGLFGFVAMQAHSAAPTLQAAIGGAFPTWFVPEGPLGFGLALLLVCLGLVVEHFARLVERVQR